MTQHAVSNDDFKTSPENAEANLGERLLNTADALLSLFGHAWGRTEALAQDAKRDSQAVAREAAALYRSTLTRAGQVGLAVRSTPRFGRIVSVATVVAASYRIFGSRLQHLPEVVAKRELDALHAANAERVALMCAELGGGVLKVGQLLSARMDLLPEPWITALATLQDNAPPVSFDEIQLAIETELGPLGDRFAEFESTPMAAASLAQVHGAVLLDGTRVAVKVQRPGVSELIGADIAAINLVAQSIGNSVAGMDLVTTAAELGRSLTEELDFGVEAVTLGEFEARWANDGRLIIPKPIMEHSTPTVLVMERIDGERLTTWLDAASAAEQARMLSTLIDCFAAQILRDGEFHGDPHPGNFRVADGKLVMLDFGCVGRIRDGGTAVWGELMAAALSRDAVRTAAGLRKLGFETHGDAPALVEDARMVEFADLFLEAFMEQVTLDLSEMDPMEQIQRGMALMQDNPIATIPGEFVLMARVLATLGGLLFAYRPNINLMMLVVPHLQASPPKARLEMTS
ncbi:MAG: ubiquinone biosynthesis protein [Myxococcota bacterium]|jgi:ubiquinone biosynthesis protein